MNTDRERDMKREIDGRKTSQVGVDSFNMLSVPRNGKPNSISPTTKGITSCLQWEVQRFKKLQTWVPQDSVSVSLKFFHHCFLPDGSFSPGYCHFYHKMDISKTQNYLLPHFFPKEKEEPVQGNKKSMKKNSHQSDQVNVKNWLT